MNYQPMKFTKKYHPEYQGSEYDWINDLVNGELSIS